VAVRQVRNEPSVAHVCGCCNSACPASNGGAGSGPSVGAGAGAANCHEFVLRDQRIVLISPLTENILESLLALVVDVKRARVLDQEVRGVGLVLEVVEPESVVLSVDLIEVV
jgi:hypothetical protein